MLKQIEIVKVSRNKEKDYVSYESVDIGSYFGIGGAGMTGGAVKGEKALVPFDKLDLEAQRKEITRLKEKATNEAKKEELGGKLTKEETRAGRVLRGLRRKTDIK
jgi:hypothetical protein